ncbi:MAG: sodium:proton antiporter NhaD [Bacteroidales bacterium]|nr:sodium:proton antiporter NhaD [Bacteroidales bacterium]
MFYVMIAIFILGYAAIALEHPIKVNKTASALILGVLLWVSLVVGGESILVSSDSLRHYLEGTIGTSFMDWLIHYKLIHYLGEISEILFFLLGAMTIVELVDSFQGFRIVTDKIKTLKRAKLVWIISILTFFMSAALDNLTTSIVMVALLRKLISNKKDRWFFAGMVIISANAGGAWSPIGDVTTIMLWIAGNVSTVNIMVMTFLPSLVSMLVPLAILSYTLKGNVERPDLSNSSNGDLVPVIQRNAIFFIGVSGLLFVPVFKTMFHLPPYLGMIFSLGALWVITEILHARRNDQSEQASRNLTIAGVLRKVDVPSVLFFLGILLAVSALATAGHLMLLADTLDKHIGNLYVINIIIGVLSAIVDNVPLVAGAMQMYNFPQDHYFWEFLAYCAGTGGSILIIGSAAGVAVMGMEKIDFIWYMKRLSLLALAGYLAGAGVYYLQEESGLLHGKKDHAAVVVNINDDDAILDYLTSQEFYYNHMKGHDEGLEIEHQNGIYLYFIKFEDEKEDKFYLGYNLKVIEGDSETWNGSLKRSDITFKKIDKQSVSFLIMGTRYRLTDQGELHEFGMQEGLEFHREWIIQETE